MTQTLKQAMALSILLLIADSVYSQIVTEGIDVKLNNGKTVIDGKVEMTGQVDIRDEFRIIEKAIAWNPRSDKFASSHLTLRSWDVGESNAYVGLTFEQQNRYAVMIRARANGFHFTAKTSNTYRNLHASGFNQTSDLSFKTDIQTIPNSLELIGGLRGVTFRWIDSGQASVGFIAQEVELVLPEVVQGEEGSKSVQYANIVAVVVEAIKELKSKVAVLEAEVQSLKGQ